MIKSLRPPSFSTDFTQKLNWKNLSWTGPHLWLLAIVGGTFGLFWHWQVLHLGVDGLVLGIAAVILIKRRGNSIQFDSKPWATLLGLILLAWSLLRTFSLQRYPDDLITAFAPTFATLGLALLAIGFGGLRTHWREITCMSLAWIPTIFVPGVTLIDAKISHYLLWYLGFDATRRGLMILLPNGAIEIYHACSSVGLALVLLKLAIALCFIYPVAKLQRIQVFALALGLAFGLNGIRLGLLAVLIDQGNRSGFNYWHGHSGAQIFSNVAVLSFGGIFYWISQNSSQHLSQHPSQHSSQQKH